MSLSRVKGIMLEHGFSGLPVVAEGNLLVGIITGRDMRVVDPASEALIRFMTALERETKETPVTVEEIRLVYWLEGYTENGGVSEDTAVPYWCIEYNGGNSVHIAAYEE